MANTIAIARNQKIFAVKETVRGTLVPPATGNLIIAAGMGSINQQPSFTNSPEINASRDIINRFQDRTPPGSWSFPVLLRPSGTAGTAPQEDVLMECLLGTKTVTSETSVVYTPALEKPSFSIWMKKDHTVFFGSGATVGSAKFSLATKGGATVELSGKFMKMGWAGTDTTVGTIASAATAITVADARKFTVGARFEFVEAGVAKNNSGAGYAVTAVDTDTNTLTIGSPGAEE